MNICNKIKIPFFVVDVMGLLGGMRVVKKRRTTELCRLAIMKWTWEVILSRSGQMCL